MSETLSLKQLFFKAEKLHYNNRTDWPLSINDLFKDEFPGINLHMIDTKSMDIFYKGMPIAKMVYVDNRKDGDTIHIYRMDKYKSIDYIKPNVYSVDEDITAILRIVENKIIRNNKVFKLTLSHQILYGKDTPRENHEAVTHLILDGVPNDYTVSEFIKDHADWSLRNILDKYADSYYNINN